MKVSELTGAQLDYWVAQAEQHALSADVDHGKRPFQPSSNWTQGGPIIERESITVCKLDTSEWFACITNMQHWIDTDIYQEDWKGSTPLIAAMRCYVASKFGEEIRAGR